MVFIVVGGRAMGYIWPLRWEGGYNGKNPYLSRTESVYKNKIYSPWRRFFLVMWIIELHNNKSNNVFRLKILPKVGREPSTLGVRVPCSTHWASRAWKVVLPVQFDCPVGSYHQHFSGTGGSAVVVQVVVNRQHSSEIRIGLARNYAPPHEIVPIYPLQKLYHPLCCIYG